MSESSKTLAFILAGAAALGGAFFVERHTAVFDVEELVGTVQIGRASCRERV